MAEISNKPTRQTGTRTARSGSAKSTENTGRNRNGNVTHQARTSNANNGNQAEQLPRQEKHLRSYIAPDSESDFRAARQPSRGRQISSFSDHQFNESRSNGNRAARPGNYKRNDANHGNRRNFQNRAPQNGQQWSPSEASYHSGLHELRGSDWYREDQARYAAQQIANERNPTNGADTDGNSSATPRNADSKRANNQRGRQRRRPPNQRNGNSQHNAGADGNRKTEGNEQHKATGRAGSTRPPNNRKSSNPSRNRPGNNNSPIASTNTQNVDNSSTKASDNKSNNGAPDTAAVATGASTESSASTNNNNQSSDTPAREHAKARRAPWRTQKHGARRKTTGPSTN